jgi:hypothetical protein
MDSVIEKPLFADKHTGNSFLRIFNAGGPGALTTANGIQVVETTNGATTASGAFALAGALQVGVNDSLAGGGHAA